MRFGIASIITIAATFVTTTLASPYLRAHPGVERSSIWDANTTHPKGFFNAPLIVTAKPINGTSLPYTLFNQLSYLSDNAVYTGDAKFHPQSEPLLLEYGSGSSSLTFTSWKGVPTGWQNLYAYYNGTNPLGLTTPHSGFVPFGASILGWSISRRGVISFQKKEIFLACPVDGKIVGGTELAKGTYQIFYQNQVFHFINKRGCIKVYLIAISFCSN